MNKNYINQYIKYIIFSNKKTLAIIIILFIEYLSENHLKKTILKFIEILPKISLKKNNFPNIFY